MRIVLLLEAEHHLALTVGAALSHRLNCQRHLRLMRSARRRNVTPVGLACHFPFAFGIYGERLLVLAVESASHRRTAYQLVMGGNTLEVAPSACCLILMYGRFGHL